MRNYPALDNVHELSREWMRELARAGYGERQPDTTLAILREVATPSPSRSLVSRAQVYPARSEKMQQTFWLHFGEVCEGTNSPHHYAVDVCDAGSKIDAAIIAALVALEGRPLEAGRLHEALMEFVSPEGAGGVMDEDGKLSVPPRRRVGERIPKVLRDPRQRRFLEFALLLLRHHRPGFEGMAAPEKATLVAEVCCYINEFLESHRRLLAFLEHGTPGRGGIAATRVAGRAVRAAVLKDAFGLTHRQIGEELGIPAPRDFDLKGDHPTVRKMVGQGREILERALGKEGWRKKASAMSAEIERVREAR